MRMYNIEQWPLTLYFDGECPLCAREIKILSRRAIEARLPLTPPFGMATSSRWQPSLSRQPMQGGGAENRAKQPADIENKADLESFTLSFARRRIWAICAALPKPALSASNLALKARP